MSRSEVLAAPDWVQAHLNDPGVVLVEVDEDITGPGPSTARWWASR